MFLVMRKDTRLNLRITPEFRERIERLAEYHGLTMSSYVHSVLVKAIRRESIEAFDEKPLAPVVARIKPGQTVETEIDQVRRQFKDGMPLATSSKATMPAKLKDTTHTKTKRQA